MKRRRIMQFGLLLWATAVVLANQPAFAGLVINGVRANNQSLAGRDGLMTNWVELHNPSGGPVDLARMSPTDQLDDFQRWILPAGANMAACGHLVVRSDAALRPRRITPDLASKPPATPVTSWVRPRRVALFWTGLRLGFRHPT